MCRNFLRSLVIISIRFFPIWLLYDAFPKRVSASLKPQIPRPLEGQASPVPLRQQAVFGTAEGELHPVPALHLEGGEVPGGGDGIADGIVGAVAAAGDIGPLGHHFGGNRQLGGGVVPIPGSHAPDRRDDERADDDGEHPKEQVRENPKQEAEAPHSKL